MILGNDPLQRRLNHLNRRCREHVEIKVESIDSSIENLVNLFDIVFEANALAHLNQIVAPTENVSVLRGYAANLNEVRVVTVNSVPFFITTAPYAEIVCGLPICLGLNDEFNYTSLSQASFPVTPRSRSRTRRA